MHNPGTQRRTDTPRNRYLELVCTAMDANQHLQMTKRTKFSTKWKNEVKNEMTSQRDKTLKKGKVFAHSVF